MLTGSVPINGDTTKGGPLETGFRSLLFIVAVLYTGFVVYGSLVPLNYEPLSLGEAWQRFTHFLELGARRRSDWVANIVLFIPLAALWLGALSDSARSRSGALGWTLLVAMGALGLGVGIEFVQLFFPDRTTSRFDVLAQLLGIIIGLVAWPMCRAPLFNGYQLWREAPPGRQKLRLLLAIYLVVLVAYNVMPLDLTISPADFYHKWQDGRLALNPFRLDKSGVAENLYELGVDALIWVPPALLLALEGTRSTARSLALVLGAALALEFLQLLVYSRFTDSRDIFTAMLGGAAGAIGVRVAGLEGAVPDDAAPPPDGRHGRSTHGPIALIVSVAWFAILLVVFWFPFEFVFEPQTVLRRFEAMMSVPLHAYYAGTEYNAITQVTRKVLFFLPLGLLFGLLRRSTPMVVAATAAVALLVELGQVFLPGKTLDLADVAFASLGGFFGYAILNQINPARSPVARDSRRSIAADQPTPHWAWVFAPYALLLAVSAAAAGAVAQASALPYNIRELFAPGAAASAGGALAAALSLMVGAPVGLAFWLQRGALASRLVLYPLLALSVGAVIWLLLWASIPMESLHDIVGSPVLDWPWHWEVLLRFVVLQLPFVVIGTGAAAMVSASMVGAPSATRAVARWLPPALLLLGLAHWVVVSQAATDNLIELMEAGGSVWSSLALGVWVLICALSAYLAAMALCRRSFVVITVSTLAVLVSFPVGYGLLVLGLEDTVLKYGRNFSALQFLLSPERDQLVSGAALVLRYGQFHALWLAASALLSLPIWITLRPRAASRPAALPGLQAPAAARTVTTTPAERTEVREESGGGYRVVRLHPEQLEFLEEVSTRMQTNVANCLQRILDGYIAQRTTPAGLPANQQDFADGALPTAGESAPSGNLHSVDVWFPGDQLSRLEALGRLSGMRVSGLTREAVAQFMDELQAEP